MNEAVRLIDQFEGFSEQRRDERLRLRYRIIEDHVTAFVSYVVAFAAFDAAVSAIPREFMKVHPYHMILVTMLGDFAAKRAVPIGLNERVDFVFDEEVMEQTVIHESWRDIVQGTPEGYLPYVTKTPTFCDDIDVLPLQAADLIAWLRRNEWQAQNEGKARYIPPWQPRRVIPGLDGHLHEQSIRRIMDSSLERVVRELGTRPPWEKQRD